MNPQLILLGGGALAVILLMVGILVSVRDEGALVDKRLGRYLEEEKSKGKGGDKAVPFTDWIDKAAQKTPWSDGIAKELARADLKFKVGEYLALMIFSSLAVALLAYFLGRQSTIVGVIGAVVGLFIPRMYVKRKQAQRLQHFNDQLGDMLSLVVNSLRAGYSTMQAMEAVSKELPPPISDEYRRVVQEMQLGVSMEVALDNLLRRIPSQDLDLVITAMNVQREVGGNLAEILDTISHTIRERVRIKGEIRVLTSQQAYSGRLLSVMPVLLLGALYLLNREYMMLFFAGETRIIGFIALGLAAILTGSGYFVMMKITDIDV